MLIGGACDFVCSDIPAEYLDAYDRTTVLAGTKSDIAFMVAQAVRAVGSSISDIDAEVRALAGGCGIRSYMLGLIMAQFVVVDFSSAVEHSRFQLS